MFTVFKLLFTFFFITIANNAYVTNPSVGNLRCAQSNSTYRHVDNWINDGNSDNYDVRFINSSSHILVILICQQGHTTTLIQTSIALLKSNQNFITFIVPESCPNILEPIENDDSIPSNSYQIVYSQKYEWFMDKEQMRQQTVFEVFANIPKSAFTVFPTSHYLLSTLNKQSFNNELYPNFNLNQFNNDINYNLNTMHNNISTLRLSSKIDIVISEFFDVFIPSLCKIFDVPLLLRVDALIPFEWTASFTSKITRPTGLFPKYPFKNYGEKIQNIITDIIFMSTQMYTAYFHYNPMAKLYGLPTYNFVPGGFEDAVLFQYLGRPYSPSYPLPPNIKQFGFLLNPPNMKYTKQKYKQLYEWIDIKELQDEPIILMTMGSVLFMDEQFVNDVFDVLYQLSVYERKVRIIWGLRQMEDLKHENMKLLEMNNNNKYFKISEWIPQIELLHNDKVKLFITHGGANAIHESLHAAKPMIVLPPKNDQPWNAMRIANLKCGEIIDLHTDNITLKKQFKDKINAILFKNEQFYTKNVQMIHDMIIGLDGEIQDFVKFVDYISKYGTKYFIYTDGLDKDALNWYHKTNIDFYIIGIVSIFATLRLLCCVLNCCAYATYKSKIHSKIKRN